MSASTIVIGYKTVAVRRIPVQVAENDNDFQYVWIKDSKGGHTAPF